MRKNFLFGLGVALLFKYLNDSWLEIALDDYFALLCRAAHSATGLEQSCKLFKVVIAAYEILY